VGVDMQGNLLSFGKNVINNTDQLQTDHFTGVTTIELTGEATSAQITEGKCGENFCILLSSDGDLFGRGSNTYGLVRIKQC